MKGVFLIGKKKLKRYYDQIDAFFIGSIDAILNNNETAILSCMREHPLQTYPRWGDKRIDATWQHRPGSTLAQIMACYLTSPSHYLNQRWLFVKCFVWHSAESNFSRHAHALNTYNVFGYCIFKITAISPRGQWVNKLHQYWLFSIGCTDIWLEVHIFLPEKCIS